jgi:hypothetical protein
MAGYTRQDTANNIANGNVIDADDFDAEYNQLESAFNASSGHSHDGTAGEGAPITKVGPSQDLVVSATQVLPKTTNTLDLGSASVQFKDAHFDGTVDADAFTGPLTGNVTGNVTGTVSDISNHNTDDLTEGATNQYYTDARSRAAISATGSLSYNSSTGVMSFTQGDTDTVSEGTTNLYYTDARARSAVSVTDSGGDGSLAYNSSTGVITYTGPSASEVRAHISGGTGVTITDGSIAIGQAVGTASDVTFNSVTSDLTGDVTGNADTATTLATARTIAGQSFDGSSNISIAPTDLTGVTSTAAELNILDGVTATTAEINKLDGVTATTTELNYVDGVTSAIQTQLDRRLELINETVLTSSASDVTFTLPTGYRDFQLVLNNVKSTGNTTILYIEVSTDGGSTWISSSKYSSTGVRILDSSGSASTSTSTASTGIIVSVNNGSDQTPEIGGVTYDFPTPGTSGIINIHNPHDTTQFTTFSGTTVNFSAGTGYDDDIGEPNIQIVGGAYGQKTAVNAINLSHKTGASVAAGAVVALYGMKDY